MLDEQTADRLRQIPRLAVAEIAGPADLPALRELLKHHRPDGLLPTLSYTGTEYGDWAQLGNMAAALKKTFEKELNIYVAEPVVLGSPALWKALREAHEGGAQAAFRFCLPLPRVQAVQLRASRSPVQKSRCPVFHTVAARPGSARLPGPYDAD